VIAQQHLLHAVGVITLGQWLVGACVGAALVSGGGITKAALAGNGKSGCSGRVGPHLLLLLLLPLPLPLPLRRCCCYFYCSGPASHADLHC
jgi:hypothetical protein